MESASPKNSLRSDVQDVLTDIQQAVRNGNRTLAQSLACGFRIPLGLTSQEVSSSHVIGGGAESTVMAGELDGKPVAVKKYAIRHAEDLDRFRKELLVLASLEHPNIINLAGARVLPPDYFLVMPLEGSNLRTRLYEQGWRPNWAEVLTIACELASALDHVHAHGVVHRDLKPSNLLQGLDGRVKLVDFGITEYTHVLEQQLKKPIFESKYNIIPKIARKPSGGFHKRQMAGTLEYMAPEVLLKTPHSVASDAYAFAVTINELITAMVPFADCTRDNPVCHTVLEMGYGRQELASAVAGQGLRPTVPNFSPPGYKELVTACWNMDPAQRPDFKTIQQCLQHLLTGLPLWGPTTGHQFKPLSSPTSSATNGGLYGLTNSIGITTAAEPLQYPGTPPLLSPKALLKMAHPMDADSDMVHTHPMDADTGAAQTLAGLNIADPHISSADPHTPTANLLAVSSQSLPNRHACSFNKKNNNTSTMAAETVHAAEAECAPASRLLTSVTSRLSRSSEDLHHATDPCHPEGFHEGFPEAFRISPGLRGSADESSPITSSPVLSTLDFTSAAPCPAVGPSSVTSAAGACISKPSSSAFGAVQSNSSPVWSSTQHSTGSTPPSCALSFSSPAFTASTLPPRSLSSTSPAFPLTTYLPPPPLSSSSPAFTQSSSFPTSLSHSSPAFTNPALSPAFPSHAPLSSPAYIPQVTAGIFDTINGREHMEDRSFAELNLNASASTHLFAVFDGHRGKDAAHFAAQHFLEVFQDQCTTLAVDWEKPQPTTALLTQTALSNTLVQLDSMFHERQENAWRERVSRLGLNAGTRPYPGCTALAALLHGSRLLVANAGDCRAVVSRSGVATQLTMDHTAASVSERLRLNTMGAKVEMRHGTWRIGKSGLQVTRSIGDFDEKPHGVISLPEITHYEFTPQDEFLILASDGLWDVVGTQEAVGLIMDTVKQPYMCAQRLAAEAVSRRSLDNITVIVIFLQPVPSLEEVFSRTRAAHVFTPTFFGSRNPSMILSQNSLTDLVTVDEMYDLVR